LMTKRHSMFIILHLIFIISCLSSVVESLIIPSSFVTRSLSATNFNNFPLTSSVGRIQNNDDNATTKPTKPTADILAKENVSITNSTSAPVITPNRDGMIVRAAVIRQSILKQQVELQQLERQIACCVGEEESAISSFLPFELTKKYKFNNNLKFSRSNDTANNKDVFNIDIGIAT